MNLRKKSFLLGMVLVLVTGTLFAAGAAETKVAAVKEGPTTITYYTWDDASHRALIDAFNASQSEVFVDGKILASADYETKLTTLLSGRANIDCFMEKRQGDMFAQYANGYIEPLNSYFTKTGASTAAVDAYRSSVTIGDDIVCIPWRGGSYYTYFNKNVFKKAGIPTPDYYVARGEWDWEKFTEVSKAITAADPSLIGASIYFWGSQGFWMAGQAQDKVLTSDGKIDNISNVTRQLAMRKDLEDAGAMWSLIDMKVTKTHYSKQFYDGNVGMLIIGEWFPGQMTTGERDGLLRGFTKADYGITRMPCDNEVYSTVGLPTSNHITSYSKKKDASFAFIEWMGGPEGAKVAASFGVLPAISTDEVRTIIGKNLPDESSLNYFLEDRKNYTANFSKYSSRVEAMFDQMQEEFILGKINEAQFEKKFTEGLKEIVDTTF
ncbi:MAG: extracellular solute-binding protein [Sphaerochaeta sp.]|nr:extracellular solute-binding protein [Sphaerochaeta sp.]